MTLRIFLRVRSRPPTSSMETKTNQVVPDSLAAAPFFLSKNIAVVDEHDNDRSSSISMATSLSQSLSKGSSILSLMKKYARTVSSEYRLSQTGQQYSIDEPTLLEVKYLDGRLSLRDDHARDSLRKTQTLSDSIATKLNRLGLSKMSSTQDLSATSKTLNGSYRKRILNRFRSLMDENTTDYYDIPESKPWQHKTVSELFQERKYKVNRQ